MKPVSPVLDGYEHNEVVLAKDQPQYIPLPVLVLPGKEVYMLSRWEFSEEDKILISKGGSLLLGQATFGNLYHPVSLNIHL